MEMQMKVTTNPPGGQSLAHRLGRLFAILTPDQRQRATDREAVHLRTTRGQPLSPRQRLHLLESVLTERADVAPVSS